jgi:hypothetical protein
MCAQISATNPNGNVVLTGPGSCDSTGACIPSMSQVCPNNLKCKNTMCLASCLFNNTLGDHLCVPGYYCDGNTCQTTLGTGGACSRNGQCANGMCNGGTCN